MADKCTPEEYNSLYEAINKARDNTVEIKVNKQALMNLLMDHAKLQEERHA